GIVKPFLLAEARHGRFDRLAIETFRAQLSAQLARAVEAIPQNAKRGCVTVVGWPFAVVRWPFPHLHHHPTAIGERRTANATDWRNRTVSRPRTGPDPRCRRQASTPSLPWRCRKSTECPAA